MEDKSERQTGNLINTVPSIKTVQRLRGKAFKSLVNTIGVNLKCAGQTNLKRYFIVNKTRYIEL